MLGNFKKVDMNDLVNAATAFMCLIMMVLTYSIANGIGVGSITYVICKILSGTYSKKDSVVTGIAVLFILKFCMITM